MYLRQKKKSDQREKKQCCDGRDTIKSTTSYEIGVRWGDESEVKRQCYREIHLHTQQTKK